ncbi:MAG: tRNA-dihydrouridine synthase [Sedimentisphaerales bacterium]|nr:tRNA-dihydrouridine synthase [Sedimentisphaerales bacterium]
MNSSVGLKLGNLTLDVPFFQASLSGYSDYNMRMFARRFGCPFTMADMMLAKSAANPRVLRKPIFRPGCDEHPIGAQILGRDPVTMAKAAFDLVAVGYDLIDLNFACPAPKVLRRGEGGALLNDPDTVIDILKAVRGTVNVPVLMKLRIGVNHKSESLDNFWQIVNRSVEHGVDALVIHGRTVCDRYRGRADWDAPVKVKSCLPRLTVIGSGDIFDPVTTIDLMKRTGLDGFVVARGAIGNPWIFRDLRCVWENRPVPQSPGMDEQRLIILEHFRRIKKDHPEEKAISIFRKYAVGYLKRHPKRKPAMMSLMKAGTCSDIENAVNTWYTDTCLNMQQS